MKFSTRIKEFRKEVNLTQEEFGRIAGVSDKAVSAWENGLSEPRMGAIQKLSTYFSVPKSYILGERTDDQWDEEIIVSFMETFNLDMLKMFEQLNEEGKEKVIEYVSDLVASGRYSKKK